MEEGASPPPCSALVPLHSLHSLSPAVVVGCAMDGEDRESEEWRCAGLGIDIPGDPPAHRPLLPPPDASFADVRLCHFVYVYFILFAVSD
jgi:hypothetical protein